LCILCTSGWPGRRNGISKTVADYENGWLQFSTGNWKLATGSWKLEAGKLGTGSRELVRVPLASDKIDAWDSGSLLR